MHKSAKVAALAVSLLAIAASANAQTTNLIPIGAQVFTSQSAWLAAVGGPTTTVDFQSVPTPFGTNPNGPGSFAVGPFTVSGATFSGSVLSFVLNPNPGDQFYDWGTGNVFSPQATDPQLQLNQMFVTLPGNFFAYGFQYGTNSNDSPLGTGPLGTNGTDWLLDLNNGAGSFVVPNNGTYPTLGFFGVITTTAFSGATVTITDGSLAPVFDGVSWGQPVPSAVPEPATFMLVGTGLACLVGWRRRKSGLSA